MSEVITTTTPEAVLIDSTGEQITVPGAATHTIITVAQQGPPGTGSVNSVALSVPTGFAVAGSPVVETGTIVMSFAFGYSLPTTAAQSQWATAYGWGNHATAGYLTSSAIGVTVQGYDADLTAWAGIAPAAKVDATGGAASGLTITGTKEVYAAVAAADIDLASANVFSKTISGATTFTVSNVPAAGQVGSFVLELTNGGSATVNWWAGVKWAGGTAPTLTTSGLDVLGFYTRDGGTTWRGMVLSKDSK